MKVGYKSFPILFQKVLPTNCRLKVPKRSWDTAYEKEGIYKAAKKKNSVDLKSEKNLYLFIFAEGFKHKTNNE